MYLISYKVGNGTATQQEVWEGTRIILKLGEHPDKLFPPRLGPAGLAFWLVLKIGPAWLYCMEAVTYVIDEAAAWLGPRLRPIVADLVDTQSVVRLPGLVRWLRSLDDVAGPPAMPTGLTATPDGPRVIELRWEDRSDNETGFIVFNGNEDRQVAAGQTTYRWDVEPGSYMCANVRAVNGHGESAKSPGPASLVRLHDDTAAPARRTLRMGRAGARRSAGRRP